MNLAILAEESANRFGERLNLVFEGEEATNFTTLERARRLQRAFTELGLQRGKHVGLCMANSPLVFAVFAGIFRTGATAVPVMGQLSVAEIRYIYEDNEACAVITDQLLIEKVRAAVSGLAHIEWIAVAGGENRPEATPREYCLEDLLQSDQQHALPQIASDDIAVMLYTSGTTGKPKGVMLAHENFLAMANAAIDAAEYHLRKPPLIHIYALPMAHIFGLNSMIVGYQLPDDFAANYSVQLRWFDAEKFMALIQQHRCTDMAVVPTMLAYIWNHPKRKEYDLHSLEVVGSGAAPMPEELARQFSEAYGCRIRQLYGMTENTGVATADRISQPYHPRSVGLPYKNLQLRIVGSDDQPLPPGEIGEIITRGPTTMKGYFKRSEATADAMRDGWLHTGDVGYIDEDGWLYLVDRKKDLIIRGGENIYPAEIEQIIYLHPAVAEAAVVGVPDEVFGENVWAFVVLRADSQLTEEAMGEHIRQHIAEFKAPQRIYFVNELPKSGVGKILRRELRDQAKRMLLNL